MLHNRNDKRKKKWCIRPWTRKSNAEWDKRRAEKKNRRQQTEEGKVFASFFSCLSLNWTKKTKKKHDEIKHILTKANHMKNVGKSRMSVFLERTVQHNRKTELKESEATKTTERKRKSKLRQRKIANKWMRRTEEYLFSFASIVVVYQWKWTLRLAPHWNTWVYKNTHTIFKWNSVWATKKNERIKKRTQYDVE